MTGTRAADPLVGRVFAGHYRLAEQIGEGAFGTVYRAVHTLDGREFAVKVLRQELLSDPGVRERFLREAATVARFAHECVAQVRHYGEETGTLYLVMDHCRGETLDALLRRAGPLSADRAVAVTLRILDALGAAHAAGIVHRDLKPSNVMVGFDDGAAPSVRVLDFGLARVVGELRDRAAQPTASTSAPVVGTVAYMSPEQVRALPDVDGRSDLFSLGVMLHEMLAGARPFDSDAALSTMLRILEVPPEPLPLTVRGPLRFVVERALQKDRALRFHDAAEFASALRGEIAAAPGDGGVRGTASRRRRRPWAIGVAVLVVAGIAALVLGGRRGSGDVADRRARAQAAFDDGRFEESIALYDLLAGSTEGRGEDFLQAGLARIALFDSAASMDLREAERRLPGDARVHVALARYAYEVQGDVDRAVEHLRRPLESGDPTGDALALRVSVQIGAAMKGIVRRTTIDEDLARFEAAHPRDVRGPLLRALLALVADDHRWEWNGSPLDDAAAALARASTLDPTAPDVPDMQRYLQSRRAIAAARAGEPERERRHRREALAHLDAAIALRKERVPVLGNMYWAPSRLLERRAYLLLELGDRAAAVASLRQAASVATNADDRRKILSFGLRTAGLFEEAEGHYVDLVAVEPTATATKDLAFCRFRLSQAAARAGDPSALPRAQRALQGYEEAGRMLPNPTATAYVAECRTWLARLDPPRRDQHLAAAGTLFEAAHAEAGSAPNPEVEFRRAEWLALTGRLDDALASIDSIVGDRMGLVADLYERRAMCRLGLAARSLREGRSAEALERLDRAVEDAELGASRRPHPSAVSRLLRGHADLVRAAVAPGDPARRRALEVLRAVPSSPAEEKERWLEETAVLLAEEASAALDASAAEHPLAESARLQREADWAAGRWSPSAAYWDRLAALLEARGSTDLAGRARLRAKDAWSS